MKTFNQFRKENNLRQDEEDLDEGLKHAIASTVLATAAAMSPHAHSQEPVQHPDNPHLIAHVEHNNKVHRFDLEKMFKTHEHAREHMTNALKKHGMSNHVLHITNKPSDSESPKKDYSDKTPYKAVETGKDYSDKTPYTYKKTDKDYSSPAN